MDCNPKGMLLGPLTTPPPPPQDGSYPAAKVAWLNLVYNDVCTLPAIPDPSLAEQYSAVQESSNN